MEKVEGWYDCPFCKEPQGVGIPYNYSTTELGNLIKHIVIKHTYITTFTGETGEIYFKE